MQFARVNGVTLHYQTLGGPEGRPLLVFVNSLATDFRIWRDVIVRLAGDFPMLAYDLRGHGLSDVGPLPQAIEDHAADLAALLELVGSEAAIVCGLSIGGLVAQALHAARPRLVRALVLSDTAARIGSTEGWNARIASVEAGGIDAIADQVLAGWFTEAFRRHGANLAGYHNMMVRQPLAGYLAACAALRDCDLTAAAGRIGVPTLCVVGEHDPTTTPAMMADLARRIPGARYELIREAAHLPCVEQPESFAAVLRAFLALFETEMPSHVSH